jgi:hypothetical protein
MRPLSSSSSPSSFDAFHCRSSAQMPGIPLTYQTHRPTHYAIFVVLLITLVCSFTSGCQAAVEPSSTQLTSTTTGSVSNCSQTIDHLLASNRHLKSKLHRLRVRLSKLLKQQKRRRLQKSNQNKTVDAIQPSSPAPSPSSLSSTLPSSSTRANQTPQPIKINPFKAKSAVNRQRVLSRNSDSAATSGQVFVLPRHTSGRLVAAPEQILLLHKCSGGYVHPNPSQVASSAMASYPLNQAAVLTLVRDASSPVVYLHSSDRQLLCLDAAHSPQFQVSRFIRRPLTTVN